MIPQELLGTAKIPGQRGELKLYRHDRDFIFRVHGIELMSSRVHGSEEELAELALKCLPNPEAAQVLVCGLGMGFTLAKVLELVGAEAKVEVIELVPEVVEWNREWIGELTGHPLRDERVTLHKGDVAQSIRKARSSYDAILLDVDNGPEGLMRKSNDWLYSEQGLSASRDALRPGGVLSIWSSEHHPWFTDRVRSAGFDVYAHKIRARRLKGARRTIWVATKTQR